MGALNIRSAVASGERNQHLTLDTGRDWSSILKISKLVRGFKIITDAPGQENKMPTIELVLEERDGQKLLHLDWIVPTGIVSFEFGMNSMAVQFNLDRGGDKLRFAVTDSQIALTRQAKGQPLQNITGVLLNPQYEAFPMNSALKILRALRNIAHETYFGHAPT